MESVRVLATAALVVLPITSGCGGADTRAGGDAGDEAAAVPEVTTPAVTIPGPAGPDETAVGTPASQGHRAYAFASTGAVEVEEDGVLIGWSAMEGEPGVANIGFLSGLDIVSIRFPEDFTVGEPIDLTADYTSDSGHNVDIVLDRQSFDEEIVSGTFTVTATDGVEITGTFEVTGRGEQGGQVTVTGTFENVPRE